MTMIRSIFPAEVTTEGLPDDEVVVRMSTAIRGRDGHILEPAGANLTNFRANPVVLWGHNTDEPVGMAMEISQQADCLMARCKFAPAGVSTVADKTRGLVKAGIVRGVSIGFEIIEATPIDPARPRAGLHVTSWELYECSFCSVPVDTGAGVTARSLEAAAMHDIANVRSRMLVGSPTMQVRGLYAVGELAWLLGNLGYCHDSATWEAEVEADNSQVPAMLGEALKTLGAALVAMTQEEVSELLSAKGIEIDDMGGLPGDERAYVAEGLTPTIRAFRVGVARARLRSGRVLSQGNAKALGDAATHMQKATDRADTAVAANDKAGNAHEKASDAHAAASTAHEKVGEALTAAKESPEDAASHIARAEKAHKTLGNKLDAIAENQASGGDAHGDATDAVAGAARSMRAATRCIRSVLSNSETEIQTSDGTNSDTTSEKDRADADYRRRQIELYLLADAP
jgi:HK97 family phage prohead protease